LKTTSHHTLNWVVNKEYQDVLTSQVLNTLITLEGVTKHKVVRTLSSRTVYYLTPSSLHIPPLYLKEYHCSGFLKAVKGRFYSPAEREYHLAHLLAEKGVPTFTPLAVSTVRKGGLPRKSYLLSKSIEGAQSLKEFMHDRYLNQESAGALEKKRVTVGLAEFVSNLHRKGILHRDFHWGNILIKEEGKNDYRFYLMDLHRVELKSTVSRGERIKNLASLNTGFCQVVSRAERLRFLKAYVEGDEKGKECYPRFSRLVEEKTEQMLKKIWQKREKRCLRANKYFISFKSPAYRGIIDREYYSDGLLALLKNPDQAFSEPLSTIIKDSPTASSWSMPLTISERKVEVYIKRYNYQNFFYASKYFLRASRGKRAWRRAHGFVARDIPTPHPVAFVEQRKGRFLIKSYLITRGVDRSISLATLLEKGISALPQEACTRKCEFLHQGAHLVRKMHERGVCHRDLKASNILVCEREGRKELLLIDLDSARIKRHVSREDRVRDLARLNASLLNTRRVSTTDRLRFLKCYLNVWRKRDYRVRVYWEETLRETQKKLKKTGKTFG